jgi:hypothetical protein
MRKQQPRKTPEELAAISRANGAKSRGPISKKDISKLNALKHGARAETFVVLRNENKEEITTLYNSYINYYKPASPAALHLTRQLFRAELKTIRCERAHSAIVDSQVDEASELTDNNRYKLVESDYSLMDEDPVASVAALVTTGLGCRVLIDRLEVALDTLLDLGCWTPEECGAVVRHFGYFPELDRLRESPVAYFLTLENSYCQPEPAADLIATLLRPEFMPAELAGRIRRNVDTTPAACRERIRRTLENRLARLRATKERLRTGRDARQRSQVVDPNMMIANPAEFHTYSRYASDANSSFLRCYKALEAALKADAERGESDDHQANRDPSTEAAPVGHATACIHVSRRGTQERALLAASTPADAGTAGPETPISPDEAGEASCETPEESIVPVAGTEAAESANPFLTNEPAVPARVATGSSVETTTYVDQAVLSGTHGEPSVPASDGPGEPPVPPSDGRFLVRATSERLKLLRPEAAAPPRPGGGPWPAGPPGEAGSRL